MVYVDILITRDHIIRAREKLDAVAIEAKAAVDALYGLQYTFAWKVLFEKGICADNTLVEVEYSDCTKRYVFHEVVSPAGRIRVTGFTKKGTLCKKDEYLEYHFCDNMKRQVPKETEQPKDADY